MTESRQPREALMTEALAKYAERVRMFCQRIAQEPDSVDSTETLPSIIAKEAAFLTQDGPAAYLKYAESLEPITPPPVPTHTVLLEPGELLRECIANWGTAAGSHGDGEVFPDWTAEDTSVFLQFVQQNRHASTWDAVRHELGIDDKALVALALAEAFVFWDAEVL